MTIMTHPGDTAIWYEIVHDAEKSCSVTLQQEVESYMVFLLMRYLRRPELVSRVMATCFLEALQAPMAARNEYLRTVGDQCLLLAGLYPGVAQKRRVRIGYFVGLGKSAYVASSASADDLYAQLGGQFVPLMDVLQSVRRSDPRFPDLLPIQAMELWSETGSQRALAILRQYTGAMPLTMLSTKD